MNRCVALGAMSGALMLLAGCGTTTTASPGSSAATSTAHGRTASPNDRRFFASTGPGWLAAASQTLHLTLPVLRQDLRNGQSFAQLAQKAGISLTALQQAIETAYANQIHAAIQHGQLTAAQGQQRIQQFDQRLPQLLTQSGGFRRFRPSSTSSSSS